MRHSVLPLLLLVPVVAFGQTSSLDEREASRGTQLPPTSAALADEATAMAINPAGLSAVGASQLFYVHERSIARNQVADGLYLAGTALGFGGGFSVDWVRSSTLTSYRKTGWGMSVGNPNRFSLGASFNFFSSDQSPELERMMTVDMGLLSRPYENLSVGMVVRNLNQPTQGSLSFGRRYDFGVALRPFGERANIGVDYLFNEFLGPLEGRLSYVVQAEVTRGLRLSGGFSHGFSSFDPQVQLALTFDLGHLGLTYAGGASEGGADHVVAVRLSGQRYRDFNLSPGKFALLDLDDRLASGGGTLSLLGIGRDDDPYLRLVRYFDAAERDPDLKGLVLKIDNLRGVGLAKVQELRGTLQRLRSSGRKVVALLLSADDSAYLLASAADHVYATPQSMFMINGFTAKPFFLGGTMEKLGVQWNVARVGAYKNSPDQLTRSDMSPEQRESIEAYLATDVKVFKAAIQQGRKLSSEQVDAIWQEALIPAQRAKQLGLVDEIIDPQKVDEHLDKVLPDLTYDERYNPRGVRNTRWGTRQRIAIIPVLGNISGGKSREGPLGSGVVAGAETVVKALDQAKRDPRVAAIVIRVDSGGGDGLASDLMYRAVLDAKEAKPVVASMGDVAASGGYYAAMGAHEIFASPTTITGSIGVFILKPALQGLAEKLGARQEVLKTAPFADLMDEYTPWTPEAQALAQRWVDAFYDDFITEVGKSRRLGKAQVDAVARGRVWSGEDAKARGLVDRLGGIADAIAAAKQRAGVEGEELELVVYGEAHGLFSSPGGEEGVEGVVQALDGSGALRGLLPADVRESLPPGLRELAAQLGVHAELLRAPGVKAVMPFTLVVD
ncbi:MAG TPA: signal peptide peptidase SppA [Myxococcaceae bacterium]|nr:signal peptide peptidase SppA [Myxococcaceae bacterium]